MASITASPSTLLIARASLVQDRRIGISSSQVLGFPSINKKGKVRCSMEGKPTSSTQERNSNINMSMGTSLLAAVMAATTSSPAMGLVDERISTEGTGLPLGLSNNLLGWVILGVFGTIWALYYTWASTLEEDEDSGLSL